MQVDKLLNSCWRKHHNSQGRSCKSPQASPQHNARAQMGSLACCRKDHAKMTNSRCVMLTRDQSSEARSAHGHLDCLGSTVSTAAASAGRRARRKSRRCVLERDLETPRAVLPALGQAVVPSFFLSVSEEQTRRRVPSKDL